MVDQNTGNLLEAFRTQSQQKQLNEPKALSSGQMVPKKTTKRKIRNAMIKIYVNGAMLLIASALVFVAYRLAVIPQLFPPEADAKPKTDQVAAQQKPQDYQGAANYGLTFGYYWIKGDLKTAQGYLATNFVLPENVLTPANKEILWSKIWQVDPIDEKKLNVIVQAAVKSTPTEGNENQSGGTEVVYLSVPMIMESGGYGVSDIPTYVPPPGRATYKKEVTKNAPIQQKDQDNIRGRVKLFLDEYFGGQPEKLAIYYKDNQPRAVLENAELKGIHEIFINQVEEKNDKKVRVDVMAKTTINGVEMLQKFQIFMVKSGEDWDIEKTNPHLPNAKIVKNNK